MAKGASASGPGDVHAVLASIPPFLIEGRDFTGCRSTARYFTRCSSRNPSASRQDRSVTASL